MEAKPATGTGLTPRPYTNEPQPSNRETDLEVSPDEAAGGDNEIVRRLRDIDVDGTTPRAALELIAELKKMAEER